LFKDFKLKRGSDAKLSKNFSIVLKHTQRGVFNCAKKRKNKRGYCKKSKKKDSKEHPVEEELL